MKYNIMNCGLYLFLKNQLYDHNGKTSWTTVDHDLNQRENDILLKVWQLLRTLPLDVRTKQDAPLSV